ncbi:glycosyltransferase family 4 protein [Cellulomonas taurus]|uniref:glycosyltransferase family 4 protein n=1 Tax=Cellulomonas taurus TaxID=2729175 RepID=UPI00145D393F|nr:glycosyltransferase family 4 protein [Cellulomonas taurus]
MPSHWLIATTEYAGLTPYTGGIGRHYAALAPALVRAGARVDLLLLGGDPVPAQEVAGVRVLAAPGVTGPWHRAGVVRAAFSAGRYDRVFLPEWAALGVRLPTEAPLLTNLATSTRLINEIAGFTPRSFGVRQGTAIRVQQRREDRQVRRSAGLIAISRAMLAWNRRTLGSLPPARVVRNCIDVAGVRAAAGSAALPEGWPTGAGPVVLFLGRLERRKGIVEAFGAFAELSRRRPDARLVLAGASGDRRFEPDRPTLLGMLPAAARERVTWLGHVAGPALHRAVAAATVTICPSRWEGFGNAALEAKAVGSPVVLTSGSGYDDFCTDGEDSLLVPPGEAPALAAAILRLLDDPALARRLGERARAGADHYTADPVAADLLAAADQLLG